MTTHPPDRAARPAVGFTSLAIWFAVITGLVEMAVPARRYAAGSKLRLDPQVVWMAPLSVILIFGLVALGFALAARRIDRRKVFVAAVATFTWLALWSWPFLLPRLWKPAVLLLMAGVAVQLARLVARREAGFARLVRRTVWPLVAAVALLATGLNAVLWKRERDALAALPVAPAGAKNVILLILDTVRARSLSLYGYDRPTTPNLQRFAARGVRFDRAISTASWTLPSHASMFTGRWPHELSTGWLKPLDGRFPTLAEHFAGHGYATGGFVANILYTSRETGLARGFVRYEDYPVSLGQVVVSSSIGRLLTEFAERATGRVVYPERKRAGRINGDFLDWIDHGRGARPYFAFLNYYDAHDPYDPSEEYERRFVARRPTTLRATNDRISDAEAHALRDQYEAAIAELDAGLGELFAALERRGQLDSTIVVITSDHGEEFNEHGIWGHGSTLYRTALRVPLIIALPGGRDAGRVVADPVTLRDLASTIVAEAGLAPVAPFPGAPLLRGRDTSAARPPVVSEVQFAPRVPSWFPVARGDMRSVVDGNFHYIRDGKGAEELYDLATDTLEQRNLAGEPEARPTLERLRDLLRRTLEATGDTVRIAAGGS